MGGADLQLNLLKWLTNLKICYTNSLSKMYPVAPLHKVKHFSSNYVAVTKKNSPVFILKADSGATCHYLKNEHSSLKTKLNKIIRRPTRYTTK